MSTTIVDPARAPSDSSGLLANHLGATWFFIALAVLLVVRIWHVRRRRK